ncbi:MAG: TRAP transporter small permease [Rhodobacteraceae bacterium]|nr:TRAP transporter small permease [Paracoccaceae bacterium]
MHPIDRLDLIAMRVARLQALFGVLALLVLAVLIILNVLLRWLFSAPLLWVTDVQSLAVAVGVGACFATSLAERHHIRLRLLGSILGPRWQQAIESFAAFATLVVFAVLVWQLYIFTERNAARGLSTILMNWPRAPFWWTVTGLVAVATLLQAVGLVVDIARAVLNRPPPGAPGTDSLGRESV